MNPAAELERLNPLVGEWNVETSLAPPGTTRARAVFEWTLRRPVPPAAHGTR